MMMVMTMMHAHEEAKIHSISFEFDNNRLVSSSPCPSFPVFPEVISSARQSTGLSGWIVRREERRQR